jgi:hypothetical protein
MRRTKAIDPGGRTERLRIGRLPNTHMDLPGRLAVLAHPQLM